MTEDIYTKIAKKKNRDKKVPARSDDGFSNSNSQSQVIKINQAEDDLVHTAKPKSVALEVSVRQKIDEYLFHHKEVSWDTLIEAAICHALDSESHERIISDAADRLVKRKNSSTKRRIQTMTQNIYHK